MRDFIAELKKKKRDLTIGGIITLIAMFLCTKTPYNLLRFVPIIGYIIFSVKICPNCNLYKILKIVRVVGKDWSKLSLTIKKDRLLKSVLFYSYE
jgi:hypothetical protein